MSTAMWLGLVAGCLFLAPKLFPKNGSLSKLPTWEKIKTLPGFKELSNLNAKQKSVLGSWFLLNLVFALMSWDVYWALFRTFWLWAGIQVFVITLAVVWFPIGRTGDTGRKWIQRLAIIFLVIGLTRGLTGLKVEPWQSDGLAKVFDIQLKEKMWDDAKETAKLLGEPRRSDWLDEVVEDQVKEKLILEARDTANIMAEPKRSEWLAKIYEIQVKRDATKEDAKETRARLAQERPRETTPEKKIATQTKFSLSNSWFGWEDKEFNPDELLDGVDTWWQRRQQKKAIAEAKAKEVIWKGEQIIVAPVTDDWSKAAEIKLPISFRGWNLTVIDTETSGKWETKYKVAGQEKLYQGDGLPGRTGPDLPRGGVVKFRSLESEPLNILFQWR